MVQVYRRHNPARCGYTSLRDRRCNCPLWVVGYVDGKRIRKALKTRNYDAAQRQVRAWEVEGTQPGPPARATIEKLRDRFLADAAARHLAPETIRKYKYVFRHLLAFARATGLVFVGDLGVEQLTTYRATWKLAASTAAHWTEILRTVFHFAVAQKIASTNPAVRLRLPNTKAKPTLPFTQAQMDKIIAAAETDPRTLAFIYVMRFGGLRISDCTLLAATALQDGDKLHLYTAKTGQPVRVPLPAYVVKALRAVPHQSPGYFFWSGHSTVPGATAIWRKRVAAVFAKAGVEGNCHMLRDTFAVGLLQAGVSIENVATLLGHSSIKITQAHYAPWVRTRQDALERAVYNAHETGAELD